MKEKKNMFFGLGAFMSVAAIFLGGANFGDKQETDKVNQNLNEDARNQAAPQPPK